MERSERGGEKVAPGYSAMQVAHAIGISPAAFTKLHRWDRLLLTYFVRLRSYYEWKAVEKRKNEKPEGQGFRTKLPTLKR